MKPSKKKKLKKIIEEKVFRLFLSEKKKSMNHKQVAAKLGEKDDQIRLLIAEALKTLEREKKIKMIDHGRYRLISSNAGRKEGRIDISRRGSIFFMSEDLPDDLAVNKKKSINVLKGDTVLAEVSMHKGKEVATIIEVLHRESKSYVGTIDISENFAFLKPDDPFMPVDIFVPLNRLKRANTGEKVLVNITDWPDSADSPFGEVVTVIGKPGDTNVEMESILYEFGLPFDFPQEVLDAAEAIPTEITSKDMKEREDMREVLTFTIDPDDAKDFDDALSFERTDKKDRYRIGVHIADVSHYVKEDSILDKEASKRATSVYLANQVVPMLPEVLSNGLCSLRPNEDKLCFSCIFDIDSTGKVHDYWIGRTAIHSDRRFTYAEAQEVIESGQGDLAEELAIMNGIARSLREARMAVGGFEFSSDELKFKYNDKGEPVGVEKKVIMEANELIEDYMLLANKHVALWIDTFKPQPPFVYRNHDNPDPEKLANLKKFAHTFGLSIDVHSPDIRLEFKKLLEAAKGTASQGAIQQMVIRSMSKADYGTENIGHYGLNFDHYSHFTSPIRRYPDVLAHRLLWKYLHQNMKVDRNQIEFKAKHSSLMERKAVEAERASVKFMQALFMEKFVGERFEGTISGVTRFGLFVSMDENYCEGMVSLRGMDDDSYQYDETTGVISGLRKGKTYRLGDRVKVRVKSADALARQIDLDMV